MKNIVHNYSEAEIKVREATSNDPWGPSSSLMSEIADLTYNVVAFSEIMSMIWKRLNDHGKNWRHVYKVMPCCSFSHWNLGIWDPCHPHISPLRLEENLGVLAPKLLALSQQASPSCAYPKCPGSQNPLLL